MVCGPTSDFSISAFQCLSFCLSFCPSNFCFLLSTFCFPLGLLSAFCFPQSAFARTPNRHLFRNFVLTLTRGASWKTRSTIRPPRGMLSRMNANGHGQDRSNIHRIELKLRDISQLFNTMDPSPFNEKDLDHDAEEFIVSWAREFPLHEPVDWLSI